MSGNADITRTGDQAYWKRRAQQERIAADAAIDKGAAHVHAQLAALYERRVESMEPGVETALAVVADR